MDFDEKSGSAGIAGEGNFIDAGMAVRRAGGAVGNETAIHPEAVEIGCRDVEDGWHVAFGEIEGKAERRRDVHRVGGKLNPSWGHHGRESFMLPTRRSRERQGDHRSRRPKS